LVEKKERQTLPFSAGVEAAEKKTPSAEQAEEGRPRSARPARPLCGS